MEDLEDIRRRRLQELQRRQQQGNAAGQDPAAAEAQKAAEQQAAVESLLQQILEPEARERLTRIRMSRPDFADQVVGQLVALVRSGRLKKRLTDDDLRSVLTQMAPSDRDFSITRK